MCDDTRGFNTAVAVTETEKPGDCYLVTVAVDDYPDESGFNTLQYPVRDAEDLQKILSNEYGAKPSLSLHNANANYESIEQTFNDFPSNTEIRENDTLILFFAGHGMINNDSFFFIPYDGKVSSERFNLSTDAILRWLKDIPYRNLLMIIDCCFSGGIIDGVVEKGIYNQNIMGSGNQKELLVLASVDRTQKAPDKSVFFRDLTNCLQDHSTRYFHFSDLENYFIARRNGAESHRIPRRSDAPVLVKKYPIPPVSPFKEALFDLNFDEQIPLIRKRPRLVNLFYLSGAKRCGHHLVVQRFLKEQRHWQNQEALDKAHKLARFQLRLKDHEGDKPGESLLMQFRDKYLSAYQDASQAKEKKSAIRKFLEENLETEYMLIWIRIDENFPLEADDDPNVDPALNLIQEFWKEVIDLLAQEATDPSTGEQKLKPILNKGEHLFIVVVDKRGMETKPDKSRFTEPDWSRCYLFDPIAQLDYEDGLVHWHEKHSHPREILGDVFAELMQSDQIEERPYFIQDAIQLICASCKREEIYFELFSNKWS